MNKKVSHLLNLVTELAQANQIKDVLNGKIERFNKNLELLRAQGHQFPYSKFSALKDIKLSTTNELIFDE